MVSSLVAFVVVSLLAFLVASPFSWGHLAGRDRPLVRLRGGVGGERDGRHSAAEPADPTGGEAGTGSRHDRGSTNACRHKTAPPRGVRSSALSFSSDLRRAHGKLFEGEAPNRPR